MSALWEAPGVWRLSDEAVAEDTAGEASLCDWKVNYTRIFGNNIQIFLPTIEFQNLL